MGGRALVVAFVLLAVGTACGADDEPGSAEAPDAPALDSSVVVAGGTPGFMIGRGADLQVVEGVTVPEFFSNEGPIAVPFGEDSAAIDGGEEIAIASPDGETIVADCPECAGIAAVGGEVITTRRNFQPGGGFDIVRYDEQLEVRESVPARRLAERDAGTYDTSFASPVTMAASSDRVTVAYLSVLSGGRGGPTIVAQYAYDGELLDSVEVGGRYGRSAVSPDGRYLALGYGGSFGACSSISWLAVIALDGLELLDTEPRVPAEVIAGFDGLDEPWFDITDLVWDGDVVLATGEAYRTGWAENGSDCEEPEVWVRAYDTTTGNFTDVRGQDVRARRSLGPDCDHVLEIRGQPFRSSASTTDEAQLVAVVDGHEQTLGPYQTLSLGVSVAPDC